MMGGWLAAASVLAWLWTSGATLAQNSQTDVLGSSQAAIGGAVAGFSFIATDGRKIRIEDFRGKPLLVTLVYTSCADVCPAVIESLANATDAVDDTLGAESYNILTVGFDTRRDTPERMQSFARAHGAGGGNWVFAASRGDSIERFASAVGFSYFEQAGGYGHPAQVTVLDGKGKVFDQIYGGSFDPPAVIEPLKRAMTGAARTVFSLEGLASRIKLICTVYDPRTGRYSYDYSILASFAVGAACLLAVLCFLVRETRKSFRGGV